MDENLVGYLLHALDAESHRQVEEYLHDHPEARKRLDLLRQALEPLAEDREDAAPPPGLAVRTLAKVAEYRCRPVAEPPPAPPLRGVPAPRRWWRRADMLVAAAIVLAVMGLLLQGVARVRATHSRIDCAHNLRNFHQALMTFSHTHQGDFPGVPFQHRYLDPDKEFRPIYGDPRFNVAGIFVAELFENGCLGPDLTIRCPANGAKALPDYRLHDLELLRLRSPEGLEKAINRLAGCYAYSLGFRSNGIHNNLWRDPEELSNELLPIMADRPRVTKEGGRTNTPNHWGGQNVLFIGGHVRFNCTSRAGIEDDDIYLNREGKVAAGVNRWDSVLGSSGDQP
jgi:hypothetical protein